MSLLTGSEPAVAAQQENGPEVTIRLENISVRYRVPHERMGTFKEYIIRVLQRRVNHDEFWALRDVNLEVRRGEVFGIVCLLYTSDAADDLLCVDLGGRRIIKKK